MTSKVDLNSLVRPNRFPWNWNFLQRIGDAKLVKASYFWALLVPVVAVALAPLPVELPIHLGFTSFTVGTTLPFKWFVLYLASVFFTVGEVAFRLSCPEFTRLFPDFETYKKREGGTYELNKHFHEVLRKAGGQTGSWPIDWAKACITNLPLASEHMSPLAHGSELREYALGNHGEDQAPVSRQVADVVTNQTELAFGCVRAYYACMHPKTRLITTLAFLAGFTCIGVVFVQSLVTVFAAEFKH